MRTGGIARRNSLNVLRIVSSVILLLWNVFGATLLSRKYSAVIVASVL